MSARWDGGELLQPITADRPCGEDVEYTLLPALEGYQLFGQSRRLDVAEAPKDGSGQRPWQPPEWSEVRARALEGLARSKDLRLLAHLAVSLLRTDGVPAFARSLSVASQWLTNYWTGIYPLVDDDAMTRRNALNCLADPMAVVDAVRRAPLVSSRQHGRISVRDIEIAAGLLQPANGEQRTDEGQIQAAFAEMPTEDLAVLHESVAEGLAALKQIEAAMLAQAGLEAVPAFEPLSAQLGKVEKVVREHLQVRAPLEGTADGGPGGAQSDGVIAVGTIKSRQDAIRALDAAAEFFRHNEPSSPVPLFIERAKRLVSKNFLEVLADVAPDGLPQARSVSGLPNE